MNQGSVFWEVFRLNIMIKQLAFESQAARAQEKKKKLKTKTDKKKKQQPEVRFSDNRVTSAALQIGYSHVRQQRGLQ